MKKSMLIIIIILATVVLTAGGYLGYKYWQLSDENLSSKLVLDFFAGGSITGNSFKVRVVDRQINYGELEPGRTSPVKKFERTLSLSEFESLIKTIEDSDLLNLQSQDFKKDPLIPDQGFYNVSVTLNNRKNTVQCGIYPISPSEGYESKAKKCLNKIDQLRNRLNSLLKVNIY